MRALCRIRPQPHYRREAFIAGLERAGYDLSQRAFSPVRGDALVIWNRYGQFEREADQWERSGGLVIVAENGYIGKDAQGRQLYAISVPQHHHGLPTGSDDRFSALGIELKPWREDGDYILICGQRGIGSVLMRSPPNWHVAMASRLAKITEMPIRVRTHPGNNAPAVTLEEDLRHAYACVVWSSGSGVKALSLGVPVFFSAPRWICEGAALRPECLDTPCREDDRRLAAFRRMAHCQFTVDEIASGLPFRRILESMPG